MKDNPALRAKGRPVAPRAIAVLATLAMGLGSHAAFAQTTNSGVSIGPSEALNPANAPPPAPSTHLFGDWGGIRTYLDKLGIDVIVDLTSETAGNVSGGLQKGATSPGQIGYEADIDWQKLAGIPGLSTHTVFVTRYGSPLANTIGDQVLPAQEIYGAGGNVAFHFVYTYAEESLLNGRLDIAAGRMPELNDFSSSPLYCNFMTNALCGNPKTLPGGSVGFSSYPDGVWGVRVRGRPTPDTYIQIGAFEVNQGLYSNKFFRSNLEFNTSQISGAMIPVEAAYEPQIGPNQMQGHYKIGVGYDTTNYNKFLDTTSSFIAGNNGHEKRVGVWALADQMVVRNGPGASDGLVLLAGYAHMTPGTSSYTDQVFAGALYSDFWAARPADTIGFLFTWQSMSGSLGKQQALDSEFGLPFVNEAGSTNPGIQTHEEQIELNYDITVGHGINLQPTFQYVFRPNAQSNIKDAAVLGIKTHVNF
jgi:porin